MRSKLRVLCALCVRQNLRGLRELCVRCQLRGLRVRKIVGDFAGDARGVVLSVEALPFAGAPDGLGRIHRLGPRVQVRLLRAVVAEVEREAPRVEGAQPRHARVGEAPVERKGRAEVGRLRELVHDEPGEEEPARLGVVGVRPVVADLGGRERDDLPGVGGVRGDLLIAGHPGVEDRLAEPVLPRAERDAAEHRAVRQREESRALALRPPFFLVVHTMNGSIPRATRGTSRFRTQRPQSREPLCPRTPLFRFKNRPPLARSFYIFVRAETKRMKSDSGGAARAGRMR